MSSLTVEPQIKERDAGFFVKMGWVMTIVGAGAVGVAATGSAPSVSTSGDGFVLVSEAVRVAVAATPRPPRRRLRRVSA